MPYRDIHKLTYYWLDTINKTSHYSQYGRNCTAFRCRKIVRNCKQLSANGLIHLICINVIQFNKSDGRR